MRSVEVEVECPSCPPLSYPYFVDFRCILVLPLSNPNHAPPRSRNVQLLSRTSRHATPFSRLPLSPSSLSLSLSVTVELMFPSLSSDVRVTYGKLVDGSQSTLQYSTTRVMSRFVAEEPVSRKGVSLP